MQKGFNSDISFRGNSYHVQTEDWGTANPFLVSRVFKSGAVLRTIKTSYNEALQSESIKNSEAIKAALKKQHLKVCDLVHTGEIS